MAFYPDVAPGDKFQPNAKLSNNLRHLLNSMDGFSAKSVVKSISTPRIQVCNSSGSTLAAGTAVNFASSGSFCGEAIPVVKLTDTKKAWGVVQNTLKANAIGSCIVSGPAEVTLSGSGDYAEPQVSSPASFVRGATGVPVLFASGTKGIILLGAIAQDVYDGPFALSYDATSKQLKVNSGYLNRNGEWAGVPSATLTAQTGTVCVCTTLNSEGSWTAPAIQFSAPGQYAYPIGSCKVSGTSVSVCSFRVPVAIFIVADVCSTTN